LTRDGRDLNVADDGLETGGGLGEDRGHEVFGASALDLRGDAFAFGEAEELQAASGGPAPAVFEDGRGDGGLFEEFPAVCSVRNWKTSARGKLCCSAREMLMPLSVAAAWSSN